ncbi:MAG: efflux RND transporter permease subunit [Akkermansiaceae bacterium]|nr:efflux RND transporter permease subunit [Akkermansiaceae bacterium]
MEGLIRWFSRNHVAANFLMLAVILAGFYTWFQLRKEIFPETAIDAVAIKVPYPNATPEDVEEGVVIPVEEAIADLEGISEINSTSAENIGVVTVEAETGYDLRNLMDDIKTRVDAIDNFAENAESPVLEELLITSQVLSIAVYGDTDEATLRQVAEDVRDGLLVFKPAPVYYEGGLLGPLRFVTDSILRFIQGEAEITKVQLAGVRPYEISIEIPEKTLRRHRLTLAQVADAVRRSSLDLPAGTVKTAAGDVVIRAVGKRYDAKAFENVVVLTRPDGSVVTLGEIATIVDGFEDIDLETTFDGANAMIVNVYRVGNQDTLRIADAVREYLQQTRSQLPEGIGIEIWNDQSSFLRGRLDLLKRNGLLGLLLVFGVLALFLRPSLAFLVALGIPVSFAGGIWLMPQMGISINMISLFAFILVLGIVVDDAIVVGENVYRRMRMGEDPKEASWRGTHEVGVVVIFGIITTMVAFTPMLGLSGVSGKIWPNIPLIVIPVLFFSLLQSKLVLPAHLALLKASDPHRKVWIFGRFQRWVSYGLESFVLKVYAPFLQKCLRFRYFVAAAFIALLCIVMGIVGGGYIKSQFFPEVEADLLVAKFELPRGVPFEATQRAVAKLEEEAMKLAARHEDVDGNSVVVHMLASRGTQPLITAFAPEGPPTASNIGEVTVELRPSANRDISAEALVREWRQAVDDRGGIPGAVELTFVAQGAGGGNAIDLLVTGKDLEELRGAGEFLKSELQTYTGVIDLADSDRPGKRELRFGELTPAGRALGLRLGDVASQVRRSFYGDEAQRLQRGRDEVKVMVRYPEEERQSIENFEQMKLRTPGGAEVPLPQVVVVEEGRGPDTIQRVDRKRAIRITGDVDKTKNNANAVMGRFRNEALAELPRRFPGVQFSFEGEQQDQASSVKEIGIGFLFALVAMYVLMAIPLKSYLQPAIIMSVIPFGIVGAVLGHVLMRTELSIMSMCGIVALAGVVVNDSLVLVDYVNRHRGESKSVIEAATRAGGVRFRAILLTSLTTFAGLMPMLLETDMQARFLIPMAISLGFGILFATTITLILVPSVYVMLEDFKKAVAWLFGRHVSAPRTPSAPLQPEPGKDG